MPKSALKTSLHALTASFADSVMAAIRSASLEDLLGKAQHDSGRPTGARRRISKAARAPSSVQAPRGHPILPARPGRPVLERARRSGFAAVTADRPATSAEITDPQGLLAMGVAERLGTVQPEVAGERGREGPPSTAQSAGAAPSVRLRANETLARVSNAGVVIRRGK